MYGTSLGTLVTYNPWTVGPTALLEEVATRLNELGIHHVTVVDAERRIVGMLSETDLLRARQTRRAVLAGSGFSDTDDAPLVFARDVMTRQVLTIVPTAELAEALALLLDRQIHALPVVNDDRLVGLITSRDFVREFSYGELDRSREPISRMLNGSVVPPLAPDAPLDEALLTMQEIGVACLAVAQGDCPVGVVSQRDIVREKCRVEEQTDEHPEQPAAGTVARVVRNSPAIRPGQRLSEAAAAMVEHGLPAVTVVNQANRHLGVVTEDDILQVMYDAVA
jgi:CBS domain-containing protein